MVTQNGKREKYPERITKQLRITGDLKLAPPKARSRLGSEMTSYQRRAQIRAEQWAIQMKKKQVADDLNRLLKKLPSESQLKLPNGIIGPVSLKALRLMGEERLEEESRKQIPHNARITAKVILILGAPDLFPAKARWMLGDDDLLLRPAKAMKMSSAAEASCFNAIDGGIISHSLLPWKN